MLKDPKRMIGIEQIIQKLGICDRLGDSRFPTIRPPSIPRY